MDVVEVSELCEFYHRHTSRWQELLKAGARTDATDTAGRTALALATAPEESPSSYYADHAAVHNLLAMSKEVDL